MLSRVEYNRFTDEYFIVIPDDIIEALDLKCGDTMIWSLVDGKVMLRKKQALEVDNDEN